MADADLPSFHGIIGRSAAMQALFWQIGRVAPIDVPVLIQGESGTGKELVASAIHQLSARAARRCEPINCADLTRDLLRSELFGHERGAFSGAVARKAGVLAVANGGTVFLDEVGELAADAQAMLLRFLQSGEGRAVGATAMTRVDVRIVAATHRDLEGAVEGAAFREDLYYRLRRVVLRVPPLRERREDIALLVEHVRRQVNTRYGLSIAGVTTGALDVMLDHLWPGNVRELEAVLEQAMIFQGGGGWVRAEDLGLVRRRPVRRVPSRVAAVRPAERGDERLRSVIRRQIGLRLAAARGSVTSGELAAECGISGEQARRELVALARLGQLRRVGGGRSTRYVVP
jgi:transcriptional regulator with GAF, ATPase, and Fis domain